MRRRNSDYGQGCNVTLVTSEALATKSPHIQEDAMVFWEDADCTSQQEIRKKVKEIAEVHDILKDQAPGVPEATTGNCVLYIPVFSKLHPITELHGKDLFNVWYQCILCKYFRRIYEAFVDMAYRPYYSVEERSPSLRCQSSELDVVQERREADRCLERL
jgi:hypothetical protein